MIAAESLSARIGRGTGCKADTATRAIISLICGERIGPSVR
jgi:hypothetical protein